MVRGQTQTRGKETIHQYFNDLGFSYSQEWAVTKKGLINYCGVERIREGALPVVEVVVDVLT